MIEPIESSLREADGMLGLGAPRGAINRAYYAMFYAVRHYLRERHPDATQRMRSHAGTRTKFQELAVRVDGLDRELSGMLARVEGLRTMSDYDLDTPAPSIDQARQVVSDAHAFCRTVLAALEPDLDP